MIGIRLAAKYPELINKLVLIGASARPEFPERVEHWNTIRKSILKEDNTVLHEVFKGVQQNILPGDWIEKNPEKASNERKMMVSNSRRGMVLSIDSAVLNRIDTMDLLQKIQAKTLVICGEQDLATPLSLSKEIAKGVTNSYLETLPGVGHHAPIEVPEQITALIEEFIKK
jgi:pimeloyl-ACP methyl ester carboxylesterase